MVQTNKLMSTVLSCFSRIRLFVTPWTTACQAPLSIGFSRQEYWSGLPCPPPGDLPNPCLLFPELAGRFFTLRHLGSPVNITCKIHYQVARAQLCPTLWDPKDCSWSGYSIHGIFPARIPGWIAISSSRGSSQPRDQTRVFRLSCTACSFFTPEPLGPLQALDFLEK